MRNETTETQRARRGYLIIAALLLAAVLVFNVDAVMELTTDRLDLVALVPRAQGVTVGSPVWVAGVNSGHVTRVGFAGFVPGGSRDTTFVAIHVRLERDADRVITRTSDVRTRRVRFIAQPIVEIEPGPHGDPPVQSGDTIRGRGQPDPLDLLEEAAALPAGLDSLVHHVRRFQDLADRRRPEIERLARQLSGTIATAAELSNELQEGSLSRILDPQYGLAPRIADLQARLDQLRAAADRVGQRYGAGADDGSPETPGLSAALGDLLRSVEGTSRQLRTLQARLDTGAGFIPRASQDSALQVAVRGVQAQIDSLTAEAVSLGLRMLLP